MSAYTSLDHNSLHCSSGVAKGCVGYALHKPSPDIQGPKPSGP